MSENNHVFDLFMQHKGHNIQVVYGETKSRRSEEVVKTVSIDCINCGETLLQYDQDDI